MERKGIELWLALVAIVFITLAYFFVVVIQSSLPQAGSFFGQGIAILGFALMLFTEIGYSFRKRQHSTRWGRLASWLELHIFTGLVGPYLVLLHTSWKFDGIPGVLTLLVVIIVLSGFAGRYIYTAVPRTADGAVLEQGEIEEQIGLIEAQLEVYLAAYPTIPADLYRQIKDLPPAPSGQPARAVLERFLHQKKKLARWLATRHLSGRERVNVRMLGNLVNQRDTLRRQMASLASMRRLLGYWHIFHIPIGLGMFLLAAIHILTAVYFSVPAR